jgi:2-hydroxychromene-2-carboxylate isomerase
MPKAIDWYFDFISPFAYLQQTRFSQFPEQIIINPKPVLFAGLLNHWGHKGPAEIPAKRIFTYKHAVWLGKKLDIPLHMPPTHPFNPLRALRLAIAMENDLTSIRDIFNYIWRDGLSIEDDTDWLEFAAKIGINNPDELTAQPAIKQQLRQNTEEAIQAGVFGVPSIMADGHLFWGFDATDMYLDYQQNPKLFDESEMKLINQIPESASRSNR